jgi:PAS domain S-box-containing protein
MLETLKILFLDDDLSDAELISTVLKRSGLVFEETIASSRNSFLEAINSKKFDIVLSDHSLPDFDSLEALQAVRSLYPSIPFILVTGTVSEEFAVKIIKEGADDYLLKANLKRLRTAIEKAIEAKRMQTEKMKSEEAMRNERRFREKVLQNINVGVIATDEHGKITIMNDAAHRMYHLVEMNLSSLLKEYELRTADGKTRLDMDDFPLIRAMKREEIQNFEMILVNRFEGTRRHLVINAQPIYGENGKVLGAISATHDITNLKVSEEKLLSKIKELDTFIYHTTHDLRGPLVSILGLVAIARMETKDENLIDFLNKFDRTAIKLDNILHDLTTVTKIVRNKTNYTKIHLDTLIPALLKRIDTRFGATLDSEVQFNLDVPVKHQFLSDRYLIRTIIQNILDNSIKYKQPGVNCTVNVSVKDVNDFVRIQVSDNGQGIPEEVQQRIFDMFYKGNYSSTGTGLGLYITRVAVERLGGTITVTSNYGQGTTVTIYLPSLNDFQIERLLTEKTV